SILQAANPAAPSAKVGMGRMPRGAFLFARSVKSHGHRKNKGGCPLCKRRVVSVGRIGSMKLRAGQGDITDLAAAGSRLTRLQPTYIDAVASRSFVEETIPEAPPVPQSAPEPVELRARLVSQRHEALGL